MPPTRRRFRAVVLITFVLLLGGLFLTIPPTPPPLQISVAGRTNDFAGQRQVLIRLVNNSRGFQNFAYWAEVQTTNGWITATNWGAQHPGRLSWITSHATTELALSPPDGALVWRLKFMRMPQPSALGWKWYEVVRRTGLRRLGLRDQPPQSYSFTEPLRE